MSAATVVLLGVLAAFAIALLSNQSGEREDARGRFLERAQVSAALTESLFASTTPTAAAQLAEDFGGKIDEDRLRRQVEENQSTLFSVITDDQGKVLGTSTDDRAAAARVANSPAVVKVQEGADYMLSDYVPDIGPNGSSALVFAVAYDATDQSRRVQASVFGGPIISQFLGGTLARIPGARTTQAYILDSTGLVVASPVRDQAIGERVEEAGLITALEGGREGGYGDRHYASAPLSGSTWRVVLTTTNEDLYTGISSWVEWLILICLAVAGAVALLALYRMTTAAVEVDRANTRLEAANSELARSNLELQRSNAELEQFASVASHDLQEPLRKVQTFGDQLERRFADDIPEEGLDYLRRMRRAAGRMSILIEDLLRFSRVTTRALPPERVDLGRVAHEVVGDLETSIHDAHADVRIGTLPVIEADPSQMRQLLQNLIANGIKFSRSGVAPEVELRSAQAATGMVAFEVTDNGIGIEPEYTERIFRVFERLHPRDVYEGTGIGLALCRKIAERHGGTVEVTSEPGRGSTFRVELAAASPTGNGHRSVLPADPVPSGA